MKFLNFLNRKDNFSLKEDDKINYVQFNKIASSINIEHELLKKAIKFLNSGKHLESIEVYKQLIYANPSQRNMYESQIGINYYFLGEFENAIEYYMLSMNHGFNKSISDDNIWEAYQALYEKTKNKIYIKQYIQLFPNGNAIIIANKIISK